MKRLLLITLLLSGCGSQNEDAEQVARAVFESFNNHDWTGMEALYSDSVEMMDPSFEGVKKGKAGMTSFYQTVPDIHDDIQSLAVQGNTVVVEFVSTGTIDGQPFSLPICSVLRIEDGKVVSDHTYYDVK